MSNDGQVPGAGSPDPQIPPASFGSQPGGSWQGPTPQYPPVGGQPPGWGHPQPDQQPPGQNPPYGAQPGQYGAPGQQGQNPQYGANPGQYGTPGQPVQNPQYGAPGQPGQPQFGGQPGQFGGQPGQPQFGGQPGMNPPYGAQPGQYGAPGQPGQNPQFGAPGGSPSYGPPGAPQQPWAYSPPPNPNQPRKPNRALVGVLGGVVGVALIGGTVYAVQNANSTSPTPRPTASVSVPVPPVPSNGQPQPSVATQKASDVVSSYLRALGSGDAQTALSLAAIAPSDTTMLTDSVLARATAGMITDVSVPEVANQSATTVPATYSLNGQAVTTTFAVKNVGGQFRLQRVAAEVNLSTLARVPVTLAGLRPPGTRVQLFPGVYPVAAANKYFSFGSASVSVADLKDLTPGSRTLAVSSSGSAAINKAVAAKYTWCLKQNSLRPSGCGIWFRQPTGTKFRTSTISYRTTSGAKWSKAKKKLIGTSFVEAAAKTKVAFNVIATNGRRWSGTATITGFRAFVGSKVTATFY